MTRTIIHYFTGTGNTAHAVGMIAGQLRAEGHEVVIVQVKIDVVPPIEAFALHVIAFPVLAWAAPVMMKKYLGKLPAAVGAKAAILAVNGALIVNGKLIKGYTGQAIEQMEKGLRAKGYDVFLTSNASFPDNWTQVTNPCSAQEVREIMPIGESEVVAFMEKLRAEKREFYRCGLWNWLWTLVLASLFGLVGRRVLGKFFFADERCSGCGICAKACPANTIEMRGKIPQWNTSCEDCNRCINLCPEQAIQVSMPLFIVQSVVNMGLTIAAIVAIVVYTPRWLPVSGLLLVGLEAVAIGVASFVLLWFSCVPFDAFVRLLCRNKSARRVVGISYTRGFRRYMAGDFNPLAKHTNRSAMRAKSADS